MHSAIGDKRYWWRDSDGRVETFAGNPFDELGPLDLEVDEDAVIHVKGKK